MQQNKQKIFAIIATISIISISIISIFSLVRKNENEPKIASVESSIEQKNNEEIIETTQTETTETTEITVEEPATLSMLLANTSDNEAIEQSVKEMLNNQYQNNYLGAQEDILSALNQNNLDIEQTGYLFLPDNPAEWTKSPNSPIEQINIPLLIQKDPQWRSLSYGTNTTNQLGENGCAIVSLAMLDSYYQNRLVEPKEILNWSKNKYYVHNEGTSWQIFYDFALDHHYHFENFGNDFYRAMAAVNQGHVVIASVQPGHFTDEGHIFIIRGYDGKNVYVNDPNDDAQKMHSIRPIDESIILEDGRNYWTLYK